jgi:hypothetical protein
VSRGGRRGGDGDVYTKQERPRERELRSESSCVTVACAIQPVAIQTVACTIQPVAIQTVACAIQPVAIQPVAIQPVACAIEYDGSM